MNYVLKRTDGENLFVKLTEEQERLLIFLNDNLLFNDDVSIEDVEEDPFLKI